MKKFLVSLIRRWSMLCTVLVVFFSLTGFLGSWHRLLELTAHFRIQYFVLGLIFCAVFLIWRKWLWAGMALLAVIMNAVLIVPFYVPVTTPDSSGQHELRILHANVNTHNEEYQRFIDYVHEVNPDIITVQELDPEWMAALEKLTDTYPHVAAFPQKDNFGIALFSRVPFISSSIEFYGECGRPSIVVECAVAGDVLTIVTMHPVPPIGPGYFYYRNNQLAVVADAVAKIDGPRIVIGDLNISPWSPYFEQFLHKAGLRDGRRGFGLIPTWPTLMPLLLIPIDHCLVSSDVIVTDIRSGQNIGSDHLPLLVEIKLE